MNAKFAKTRKFVHDNQLTLAATAGSLVTSATYAYLFKSDHVLMLTANQKQLLKQGYSIVYNIKGQQLHLVNVAAVKAAQTVP